jgi:hypothetical protein
MVSHKQFEKKQHTLHARFIVSPDAEDQVKQMLQQIDFSGLRKPQPPNG